MSLLFSFFGRTGRGGFWLGVLCSFLAVAIFAAIAFLVFGVPVSMLNADGTAVALGDQPGPDSKMILNFPSLALLGVGYIAAIWIGLATQVKRAHDRGFSGWWILLAVIPLAGAIWVLVSLGILEGQEGPNKYGPDPRGARSA